MNDHGSGARDYPQVKICGLTRADEAEACAEAGADALGCVFYPPSPRNVTGDLARDIVRSLPGSVWTVGVFVDEDYSGIMRVVSHCGLRAVQLHGREHPHLVERLRRQGVTVIKTLFVNGSPSLASSRSYAASAFLLEWARGKLPGGNAMNWDWSSAVDFCRGNPALVAGGLNPDNVATAIKLAEPDAVDVSSGVESEPGRKDIAKVKRFLETVARSSVSRPVKLVFP